MRQKRKTAILLALCLMTTAAGCGNREAETPEFTSEGIELIEPVNTASNTEEAAYRNLYDYRTTVGYIYPYIQEYALSVNADFGEYTVLPGDTVKKGSLLVTADDTSLQEEIESVQKSMEDAAYAYEKEQRGYEESIAEINEEAEKLKEQIADLEENRSRYGHWNENIDQYMISAIVRVQIQLEACELRMAQIGLKAQHATELYELDMDYSNRLLEQLRKKSDAYNIYSGMDGTVISVNSYLPENWIWPVPDEPLAADMPLVAVADETQTILRCEYMSRYEVERCTDIYAFINGERYEVTYQPYTKVEYENLRDKYGKYNLTVYSSFVIDDPEGKVKTGDLAILTQIYNRAEHVLSVAKNALHRDEKGYYVYRMVDGENVLTRVRTGISDGVYTEITNGLSEHDVVLLTDNQPYGSGTATLECGTFSNSLGFNRQGGGSYQSMDVIRNPVKNGTTYVIEYCPLAGHYVKKGDLVATVRVDGDEIALYEKQLDVQRLSERLAEVVARRDECQRKYDSEYDETKKKELQKEIQGLDEDIADRQRTIDGQMEEITELERDYSTTEIYADMDGLVIWDRTYNSHNDNSSGTIAPGAALAYVVKDEFCFVKVEDERKQLALGTTVDVEYKNSKNETCTVQGVVVVANYPVAAAGISYELMSPKIGVLNDYAYIRLPREVATQLSMYEFDFDSVWGDTIISHPSYKVTASARGVNGVLLVPKKAVWEIAGKTYVYVRQEDGTVKAQSFIAGGSNADSYWVIEGLEEGMKICSE